MRYIRLPVFFLALYTGLYSCTSPVRHNPEKQIVASSREKKELYVIGFFRGKPEEVDSYDYKKLTHVIFCFSRLEGNKMIIPNEQDEEVLRKLVSRKKTHPDLKVLISFGGWGGCETCSTVFSSDTNRKAFTQSVRELLLKYNADGIDLDWESPVIGGFENHPALKEDKANFTALVKELRNTLDTNHLICFDANSFPEFIDNSIDWPAVMPLVDWVNLMTYGLPADASGRTGHHTSLYSSPFQNESVDKGVRYLDSIGVPLNKIVIGAGFYSFVCENVDSVNGGLGQKGKFKTNVTYAKLQKEYNTNNGYVYYWDSIAQAPYLYNKKIRTFVTFDDTVSVGLKTRYAINKNLLGIMFWKLNGDLPEGGLLDAIYREKSK